jgi:DNA-binding NarL/FixJ family response regulator
LLCSILIVDDNAAIRRSLTTLLQQEPSWKVVGEAENGAEGIAKARELQPRLIVLDLSMPVMNGLEAARELSQLLPRVPILMLTNYADCGLENSALAAGVRRVHSKNDINTLTHSIRDLLAQSA